MFHPPPGIGAPPLGLRRAKRITAGLVQLELFCQWPIQRTDMRFEKRFQRFTLGTTFGFTNPEARTNQSREKEVIIL